ncbi:18730_t:CDS:1 [Racocetra fulgida]|uniref:18730_t:CDS:1 n=1 Tax=Racocetra fulgida TaxID=60492 RepID=A0A9N8WN32_9GLOM|nr:18730_t:CDS:1 [Racocetra fulgida]
MPKNKSCDDSISVHTWILRDFQDHFNEIKPDAYLMSDKFGSSQQLSIHSEGETESKGPTHTWRLKVYPKGRTSSDEHLSIYIKAFPSDYETTHGIPSRTATYQFRLFRLASNSESSDGLSLLEMSKKVTQQFIFESPNQSFGSVKFCPHTKIFPNNKTSTKTDLAIQVNFFSNDQLLKDSKPSECSSLATMEKFFGDDRFNDVEFEFDCGTKIKANRFALALRSQYFEKLFGGDWMESKATTIPIRHSKAESFRAMLYYLYTTKLESGLSLDTLKNLYFEADMREIYGLRDLVVSRMADMIDQDNWGNVVEFSLQIDDERFRKRALTYVEKNWDELKKTKEMKRLFLAKCETMDWISWIEDVIKAKVFGGRI